MTKQQSGHIKPNPVFVRASGNVTSAVGNCEIRNYKLTNEGVKFQDIIGIIVVIIFVGLMGCFFYQLFVALTNRTPLTVSELVCVKYGDLHSIGKTATVDCNEWAWVTFPPDFAIPTEELQATATPPNPFRFAPVYSPKEVTHDQEP